MSEKIDWSNFENLEFCPNCPYAGDEIVFSGEGMYGLKIVVAKDQAGRHYPLACSDNGWCDGEPAIRNKPKRVTLQECWVIYTDAGLRLMSTSSADEASEYEASGYIVRHIPAEEREV